jgi:hypothetical protein
MQHQSSSSNMVFDQNTGGPSSTPFTSEPSNVAHAPSRPRPPIEKEVTLRSPDKTPIWSTHYLDPSLRTFGLSQNLTNVATMAFSGLSSGDKARYNNSTGAPADGVAKAAKEWVVPPDGRFISETGGIELGLGVVDSGAQGWGKEKGRKRARIEVMSKSGGIRVDLVHNADFSCWTG